MRSTTAAERVRELHKAIPTYEHEDACLTSTWYNNMSPVEQEDHAVERHVGDRRGYTGEQYCLDDPVGEEWCDACHDEYGDHEAYPCDTIKAVEGTL